MACRIKKDTKNTSSLLVNKGNKLFYVTLIMLNV